MSLEYKLVVRHEVNELIGNTGVEILVGGVDVTKLDNNIEDDIVRMAKRINDIIRRGIVKTNPKFKAEWEAERALLLGCFPKGMQVHVKEIPYDYCNKACCSHRHWLMVTTPKGPIHIGWRKRVIEINWRESDLPGNGDDYFLDQDKETNVGTDHIHAHGYDKAKEYLHKLLAYEEDK